MEVHMLIALNILIILALVVLTGIILSMAAGLRPVPRFNPRLLFPTGPRNDFFELVRTLTQTDTLWHPGRGDLPDSTGGGPTKRDDRTLSPQTHFLVGDEQMESTLIPLGIDSDNNAFKIFGQPGSL
jgi:hypothetical protein